MDLDSSQRKRFRLTSRDRLLLAFIAVQRHVLAAQVQTFLGVSRSTAAARLRALVSVGLLERRRELHHEPSSYLVTTKALRLLGSRLPRPRLDLSCYEHDVGLAWLWLAARAGAFGPMREVIGEREMRSADGRSPKTDQPLGVRIGGFGPAGGRRLHYPDMLLIEPQGRRIAVELELTSKGRLRRDQILAGYAVDRSVDVVLYLVRDPRLARSLAESARRHGISDRVHVQQIRDQIPAPRGDAAVEAQRARRTTRERQPANEVAR